MLSPDGFRVLACTGVDDFLYKGLLQYQGIGTSFWCGEVRSGYSAAIPVGVEALQSFLLDRGEGFIHQ